MLIWVGSQASPEFLTDVFGVTSPQHIDTHVCELPARDAPASRAVRGLVHAARLLRKNAMRVSAGLPSAYRKIQVVSI